MNTVAVRLLSQQLVKPQFASAVDVVTYMGAMQAQDYRMVRWAVDMRIRKPSEGDFRRAFDCGDIVRLHLMRGTWQLVAGADYWWLLSLYAKKAERVIRGWMKTNKVAIDDRELFAVRDVIVQTCDAKKSATKEDFSSALASRGIHMDSHRLSYHIRLAELSGTLCSGNLSPMRATYALAEGKVPPSAALSNDEMLERLARKYFQSHSPAAFDDFLWWSGLTATECRRAIAALGADLMEFRDKDRQFYIYRSCRTQGFRSGANHLLPPFDEYLVGYKSRDLVLAPEHVGHAHTGNGIFFPVVARNGIICGNWTPWQDDVAVQFFNGEADLAKQIKAYVKFRQSEAVTCQNG